MSKKHEQLIFNTNTEPTGKLYAGKLTGVYSRPTESLKPDDLVTTWGLFQSRYVVLLRRINGEISEAVRRNMRRV